MSLSLVCSHSFLTFNCNVWLHTVGKIRFVIAIFCWDISQHEKQTNNVQYLCLLTEILRKPALFCRALSKLWSWSTLELWMCFAEECAGNSYKSKMSLSFINVHECIYINELRFECWHMIAVDLKIQYQHQAQLNATQRLDACVIKYLLCLSCDWSLGRMWLWGEARGGSCRQKSLPAQLLTVGRRDLLWVISLFFLFSLMWRSFLAVFFHC